MCGYVGSSSLSLVPFKQVDVWKKIHEGAVAQGLGGALRWVSTVGEKLPRAWREKTRKQF